MKKHSLEILGEAYKNGAIDALWNKFSSFTENEKKELLASLMDLAISPKKNNKAVITPNVASVIKRKLKPGIEFNKWYVSWLPPIDPHQINNETVRDYFPVPTRVINLRLANSQDSFITIGFVYNPFDSIEELLSAKPKNVQKMESIRREVNEDLLAHSEVEFYSVASDDIFGL